MSNFISKRDLFKYFMKYSSEKKDELDKRKTRSPLLKSYLLETYSQNKVNNFKREFKNFEFNQIDNDVYQVEDLNGKTKDKPVGWLELLSNRFHVFYTSLSTKDIENRLQNSIKNSSILDSLWIPDSFYISLFDFLKSIHNNQRFTRVKMNYNTDLKYNIPNEFLDGEDNIIFEDLEAIEDNHNLEIAEPISITDDILKNLRGMQNYATPKSISMLRIPGQKGGGFDFYHNGKITNRSKNFNDYYNNIKFIINIYSTLLELIEEDVWLDFKNHRFKSSNSYVKGSPVIIEFENKISQPVFNNFIDKIFVKGYGNFRLWGEPIKISSEKIHVYGLDLHLWQEVFLELTPNTFVLILPKGVCGNTVNRFITNIQHNLDTNFKAYIGGKPYNSYIEKSFSVGVE
ncbi:MAG: hypothetical protein ACOCVD_03585 [Bacillota bacterium]